MSGAVPGRAGRPPPAPPNPKGGYLGEGKAERGADARKRFIASQKGFLDMSRGLSPCEMVNLISAILEFPPLRAFLNLREVQIDI